jgi:hypothetical protein
MKEQTCETTSTQERIVKHHEQDGYLTVLTSSKKNFEESLLKHDLNNLLDDWEEA